MTDVFRRRLALVLVPACLAMFTLDLFAKPPRPVTPANTPGAPPALGQASNAYFGPQEVNAEASDFILFDHEFVEDSIRLTLDGQDHLKQIAARAAGAPFPIIVERTESSTSADDPYGYAIHRNPDLDRRRRDAVARLLRAMNVASAADRVMVGPSPVMTLDQHDIKFIDRNLSRQNNSMFGGGGFGRGFGNLFF